MSGTLNNPTHPNAPGNAPKLGAPTEPRWAGQRPPITPARAAAIAARRRYCAALERGELDGMASGAELAIGEHVSPFAIAAALQHDPRIAALELKTLRVFTRLVVLVLAGFRGVIATHAELGALLELSVTTTRRAIAALLELGLVELVTETFEPHGAASSQRGNAYRVPDTVLRGIARDLFKFEQASGSGRSEKNAALPGDLAVPCRPGVVGPPPARRPARSSGALEPATSSTHDPSPSAVPAGGAAVSLPAVPAETRTAARKAPESGGLGERFPAASANLAAYESHCAMVAALREQIASSPHNERQYLTELLAELERGGGS